MSKFVYGGLLLGYKSQDMKVGLDVNMLAEKTDVLEPFFRIDPRGGYICQDHVEAGLFTFLRKSNTALSATQWLPARGSREA